MTDDMDYDKCEHCNAQEPLTAFSDGRWLCGSCWSAMCTKLAEEGTHEVPFAKGKQSLDEKMNRR